ncbi:MAG: nucleoside hydrolase [Candidatus Hermodarchaeota archaeon]
MIPIIFDTDMDIDCDDTGALAVIHALMDNSEAQILGVICDVPSINSAYVAQAINSYYNRPDIPIGIVKDDTFDSSKKYEKYCTDRDQGMSFKGYYPPIIVQEFKNIKFDEQKVLSCVSLYRRLLSKSKNNSVVIVAVGLLTALAQLIVSKPDRITSLSGVQLIKKKVKKLITMGMGTFPEGNAEFNWLLDWYSAQRVINHWPTPLVVSTLGSQFRNGRTLSKATPITNPVRRCYEIYLKGENRGNYSWDLIAAYHGVREQNPHFEEVRGHYIHLKQYLGKSIWTVDRKNLRKHSYLRLKSSRVAAKKELENLLTKLPKN